MSYILHTDGHVRVLYKFPYSKYVCTCDGECEHAFCSCLWSSNEAASNCVWEEVIVTKLEMIVGHLPGKLEERYEKENWSFSLGIRIQYLG